MTVLNNDPVLLLAQVKAVKAHARGCKKSPDECKMCVRAIAWFQSLSLPVLDTLLNEPTVERRYPIEDIVVDKVINAHTLSREYPEDRQKARILTERAQFTRLAEEARTIQAQQ